MNIEFVCEKCGKKTTITKYKYKGINICGPCKRRITSFMKYGVENIAQLKATQDKKKETCLKKYGVEHQSKSEDIKDKKKKTAMDRYGVEYSFQAEEVKQKIKETCLERYGVENPSFSPEIVSRIKKAVKKYNYASLLVRVKSKGFSLLTTEEEYSNIEFRETPVIIKCNTCQREIEYFNIHGNFYFPLCRTCHDKPEGGSFEEDELFNYISSIYNGTIIRNKRIDNSEIDIYLPELSIGFEYDGVFWHSENAGGKDRSYHVGKQASMAKIGIQLFHIFSSNWLHNKEKVKSIIASKLSPSANKYFARKCVIKEVSSEEAVSFLNENHIQGAIGSSVRIGLYFNNELVSLTTFGKTRFGKTYEWELYRFCNKLYSQNIGGFSKMLKYFENTYKPKSLITFSDKNLFNNNTYESSGFTRIRDSAPSYYYIKKYDSGFLETRMKYQKGRLPSILENFNPELTEWENMMNNGYDRIWDCGNRVFVKEYI